MSDDTTPEPTELALAQYQGWAKGQAFATAHLWAFQLFNAGYSIDQARSVFSNLLSAYENSGQANHPLGENGAAVKLLGLSHLEEIFECALAALIDAQSNA